MPTTPTTLMALLVLVAIAAILVANAVRRWWRRHRLRSRFERARNLENEAERLLGRKGFRVHAKKVSRVATLLVDGRACTYRVELDYLALDLRDRPFVVEVKSGEEAPDPRQTDTRRQLLEYAVVFPETHGLLLVDMEACAIHEIEFPTLVRPLAAKEEPRART